MDGDQEEQQQQLRTFQLNPRFIGNGAALHFFQNKFLSLDLSDSQEAVRCVGRRRTYVSERVAGGGQTRPDQMLVSRSSI